MYRGSRVRSPPVPVVLSVYQRGSLLDGLAMYLSCDTKKFHDNESTHILHNLLTSTHRGKLPPSPPRGATVADLSEVRKNTTFDLYFLSADFAAASNKQRKKSLLPSKNRHYISDGCQRKRTYEQTIYVAIGSSNLVAGLVT